MAIERPVKRALLSPRSSAILGRPYSINTKKGSRRLRFRFDLTPTLAKLRVQIHDARRAHEILGSLFFHLVIVTHRLITASVAALVR